MWSLKRDRLFVYVCYVCVIIVFRVSFIVFSVCFSLPGAGTDLILRSKYSAI